MRIEEDTEDLRRRRRRRGEEEERETDPVAVLLDLRKAYPRVNKPALWAILELCGMEGNCLKTLQDLHEATKYVEEGTAQRGFPRGGSVKDAPHPPASSIYTIKR